jgi:hypothetical protein
MFCVFWHDKVSCILACLCFVYSGVIKFVYFGVIRFRVFCRD